MKLLKNCLINLFFCAIVMVATGSAYAEKQASTLTQVFVREAAISQRFEIQAAEIALERGRSRKVRDMARMIMSDYTRAGACLEEAVARSALDVDIPRTLDEIHQEKLYGLRNADNFDNVYIMIQNGTYDMTVKLFDNYAKIGDDEEIRHFAYKTLPTLRSYQARLRQLIAASG